MRKWFYLVIDSPDADKIGGVECRENRHEAAVKGKEMAIDKRTRDGDPFREWVVGLGYHDFENEQDYKANWNEIVSDKLAEIDSGHLENAGLDPEEYQ